MRALVLTYHAIEAGPAPLCLSPELLAEQLDRLADLGATTLTVSELATGLKAGTLPPRAVALTFDDAFASVAEHAAPLLAARGQRATVFCVAGHLGGRNDWPSQPPGAPLRRLATVAQVRELAAAGFEIGAHGMTHAPLNRADPAIAHRELVTAKERLEGALQLSIRSFAFPYGALPSAAAAPLVRRTYDCALTTRLARAGPRSSLHAIPRVDIHYLRRPSLLAEAVHGRRDALLAVRGVAARVRRMAVKDYVEG